MIIRRPMSRAAWASAVGQTKIRAISSLPGPATARTRGTSPGASQLVITPSASAAPSDTICGRSAARASAGGGSGGVSSRKPRTLNVSPAIVTFSPARAARRNRR